MEAGARPETIERAIEYVRALASQLALATPALASPVYRNSCLYAHECAQELLAALVDLNKAILAETSF